VPVLEPLPPAEISLPEFPPDVSEGLGSEPAILILPPARDGER
jgi:hypothetical protein